MSSVSELVNGWIREEDLPCRAGLRVIRAGTRSIRCFGVSVMV